MIRVKKLLEGTLSLRNYNAKINKTYVIIKTLNTLTELKYVYNKSDYLIIYYI